MTWQKCRENGVDMSTGRLPGTSTGPGSAYADLVAGLLDAHDDLATARFDAELAAAVAAGDVSAETARVLRFWQRAAQRALLDHARTALPAALRGLDAARAETRQGVAAAERSWHEAGAARDQNPRAEPGAPRAAAASPVEPTRSAVGGVEVVDLVERSTVRQGGSAAARRRLIVAGLVSAAPDVAATERATDVEG
jgi:hypothetical protein